MRNKNLDSYTIFEAPRPRISLYCKKTKGNPKIKLAIHFTEETHTQREREREREREMYSAISSSWINLNKLRVIRWFQM
jgi:hypothetical protein